MLSLIPEKCECLCRLYDNNIEAKNNIRIFFYVLYISISYHHYEYCILYIMYFCMVSEYFVSN